MPDASYEEFVVAYRRLVQTNHPDKVSGFAPEFAEIAEQTKKEIEAAYARLNPRRGAKGT